MPLTALELLTTARKRQNWAACVAIADQIEPCLLQQPNPHHLLKYYLEMFTVYYALGQPAKAFTYFGLTEPLLLKYGSWAEYRLFMQMVVKSSFFYERKASIIHFVNQLIPTPMKMKSLKF